MAVVDADMLLRKLIRINDLSKIPDLPEKDILIPLSILTDRNLGALENIVVYLREHLNLSYSEIAKLTNRDNRTIWATYNKAKKKK